MLIAITIVQLLAALVLILIVLFQSGKSQGLSGAIGGIADSYMSKGKARTIDKRLHEIRLESLPQPRRLPAQGR